MENRKQKEGNLRSLRTYYDRTYKFPIRRNKSTEIGNSKEEQLILSRINELKERSNVPNMISNNTTIDLNKRIKLINEIKDKNSQLKKYDEFKKKRRNSFYDINKNISIKKHRKIASMDDLFIDYDNNVKDKNIEKVNHLEGDKHKNEIKRRNKSTENIYADILSKNDDHKNLICTNCYNKHKIKRKLRGKEDWDLNGKEKDLLNLRFSDKDNLLFNDLMKFKLKKYYGEKVRNNLDLQEKAILNLTYYKMSNPYNKIEHLQKSNEYSMNPLINYNPLEQDERYFIQKNKYDLKEKMIKENKDLYNFNQPRQAIKDYYNICQYKIPLQEQTYKMSEDYKKNIMKDLKKQILDKEYEKKRREKKEREMEKISLLNYNKIQEALQNEERKDQERKMKQFAYEAKLLEDYKNLNIKKKEDDEYAKKVRLNKKILDEIEQKMIFKNTHRIKDLNKLREWIEDEKKIKNSLKYKEEKELKKWQNYQEEFEIKCSHGCDPYRCSLCNRIFLRTQLMKCPVSARESFSSSFSNMTTANKSTNKDVEA